jgi:hypothetical protein
MSNITISELRPAGSELFQDSESFLNELTDREMLEIEGGGISRVFWTTFSAFTLKTRGNNSYGQTRGNTYGKTRGNTNHIGC